jgi:hypothetical protein
LSIIDEVEPEFSKVLVIRQALGQGVFKQYKPHQVETEAVLVAGFEETLQLLLPTPQDIRHKLEKLSAGTEFNSRHMYVPEEKQTGLVYMCTFPRFSKMVISDGKPVSQNLVDASVELESVFREHP